MKKILLLGGNPLNVGYLDVAKRMGAQLDIVDWSERVSWHGKKHLRADIKSANLIDVVDTSEVLFCYSSADIASFNVMEINKRVGLYGPTREEIETCIFKDKLYGVFDKAGLLGRKYLDISIDDLLNASAALKELDQFVIDNEKVVLKPTNSSSSRGVRFYSSVCPNILLGDAKDTCIQFGGRVLLDKFIDGTEYSVEMVVDKLGNVCVWPIGLKCKSIHETSEAISVKVIYNSVLDPILEKRIVDFARECAKASGVKSSLLHLELKHAPDGGLYPIEMACRSSGFVGSHLVDYVSDNSYIDIYFKVLKGDVIREENIQANDITSVYFFYDLPAGVVKSASELMSDTYFEKAGFKTHFKEIGGFYDGQKISSHLDDTTKLMYRVMTTKKALSVQENIQNAEVNLYSAAIGVG